MDKTAAPRRAPSANVTTEPPCRVVLHDSWHPMSYVVWALRREIPGTPLKRALRIMWTAHTRGSATAKVCHLELAELYAERLRARGLKASVEPVGPSA